MHQKLGFLDKLSISYCRSSGPGGSHANKTNTKAEIRFNIESADWLSQLAKAKIPEKVLRYLQMSRR